MVQQSGGSLFELQAYVRPNACRLAAVLLELSAPTSVVLGCGEVSARWAMRYPCHSSQTGFRFADARMRNGLLALSVADVLSFHGAYLTVLNPYRLGMCAANLAIVVGDDGLRIPVDQWLHEPVLPGHLEEVFVRFHDALVEERVAD